MDKKKVEHRVPILSSIPYFGKRLFTHISDIESKTDLVIQITPKIIHDNYSGINKNQFHIETENKLVNYEQNLEQENKEK